jgi:hypothetical protein
VATLVELIGDAQRRVVFLGATAAGEALLRQAKSVADLLVIRPELTVDVLLNSDSEDFLMSLVTDTASSKKRLSYAQLEVARRRILGGAASDGFVPAVKRHLGEADRVAIEKRVQVRQCHLRIPLELIVVDDRVLACTVSTYAPSLDDFEEVASESRKAQSLRDLVDFYCDPTRGGKYLSTPSDELIEMYDKKGIPRGIFPRRAFYTTEFQRYSIWGFVFNRKGELLLHQRSKTASDNPGLWDKSIGGHVDLRDSSTSLTAKRELVEELFLPEAEYTRFMTADVGDIVGFGDWLPMKRGERSLAQEIESLGSADWAMFRATDDAGEPLTITRTSHRRLKGKDAVTVFRSDVYLFVAPLGLLDSQQQLKGLVGATEASGAGADHQLMELTKLREWVEEEHSKDRARDVFTDDLLAVNESLMPMLEGFAEFVRALPDLTK